MKIDNYCSCVQDLQCWDDVHFYGRSVKIFDYASDFRALEFDNCASSCRAKDGVWILYEHDNYNGYREGNVYWLFGSDVRAADLPNKIEKRVSSARYAGDPITWQIPSLNLYEFQEFSGREQFYFDDAQQTAFGASVIITGCSNWAVYENEDCSGRSICFPAGYEFAEGICQPAFYPSQRNLDELGGKISCVIKDCSTSGIRKKSESGLTSQEINEG